MVINRGLVLHRLQTLEIQQGGYYGTDLEDIAQDLNVASRGLRKQLTQWKKRGSSFSEFSYLGKRRPPVTLDEFIEITGRRQQNPTEKKTHILSDIQTQRHFSGSIPLPKTTFYRRTRQIELELFGNEREFRWFKKHKISLPSEFDLRIERKKIRELFNYSKLQTPQGPSLRAVSKRFFEAKAWYVQYQVDPMRFYPQILKRNNNLRGLLSSIPVTQQEEIQAKIAFKIQTSFIVECKDVIISFLIQRIGRAQQSINASRQKMQNLRRTEALDSIRMDLRKMVETSTEISKLEIEKLKYHACPVIAEEELATMDLLRQKKNKYERILDILNQLTNNMEEGTIFHPNKPKNVEHIKRIHELACDQTRWKDWTDEEKRGFIRDPLLVMAIDQGNWDIARLKAIIRLIDYVKSGKITFDGSYLYQDLGTRIRDFTIKDTKGFLTREILDQFIQGSYSIDLDPFCTSLMPVKEEDDEEVLPQSWSNLSDVLQEVSAYVREHTLDWFSEHQRVFREQTEGMFSMAYDEEEFASRFYESIGYLGRNARYRDEDEFYRLRYFIKRYLSEASLLLEMRFVHRCFIALKGYDINAAIIDTMGIDNRTASLLSTYHGRYHTIGISDLRAVGINMKPLHSSSCRSTDSEAMNIVSVMDEIQKMSGDAVTIYTGDAHTVSRLSAGLVFLSHGVVAAGRIIHPPKRGLTKREIKKLRTHLPLLNMVGSLLREEPMLGRVFSMKKHIYVDGVNVRKLVYDLGFLILSNVVNYSIPVDEVCNAVELTNYIKKKIRIFEGSYTRVDQHSSGLWLKCAELIISMCGLYHLLHNWKGPHSPFSVSDIRLFIPA